MKYDINHLSNMFEKRLISAELEFMRKVYQFYPTPRAVAEIVCDMADLTTASNILEPSCGKGDLADVIYERNQNLICVELNLAMKKHLAGKPYPCQIGVDFLNYSLGTEKLFDRIVMNPPFSKQRDIDHIKHAYNMLKDGGILVSVSSILAFERDDVKSVEFRAWLKSKDAEIVHIGRGAFKESGTLVETKIIKIMGR